ncbi:PPOX class F420-dependent oxidoreductase [Microcella daejeonensis]|uniref:PPOX class F420-dependent oxidoreductase n=1 Tax=Microcella daejeonensis TaxID=2994971 RepID=A0A9E8MPL0_9MICO|nr:PPOX class F420-dependent oxidoreductase [Microcella daejeonensis]WAB82516.1 PPOX class F420-dependent oxidoreductase [Microcella daejeonensis]
MTEPAPTTPAMAPTDEQWAALGEARFISLATFRKTGARVPTTVWVAREGDALIVTTPADSGKVKRLRNSGRVQLSTSSRMGRVAGDAFVVEAHCEIAGPDGQHPSAVAALKAKYGFEYRFVLAIERRLERRKLAKGEPLADRIILRITRPTAAD